MYKRTRNVLTKIKFPIENPKQNPQKPSPHTMHVTKHQKTAHNMTDMCMHMHMLHMCMHMHMLHMCMCMYVHVRRVSAHRITHNLHSLTRHIMIATS